MDAARRALLPSSRASGNGAPVSLQFAETVSMHVGLDHVTFHGKATRRAAEPRGASRPVAAPANSPDHAMGILPSLVLRRAGLRPEHYRARPLVRRTPACLRALDARTDAEAAARLGADPRTDARALAALLIGVTSFFRDAPVFEALEQVVVPALRRRGSALHVWSAGCATGAEIYSFMMLLEEAGCLQGSTLVGTDCREDVLRQAAAAIFDRNGLAGLDERRVRRHTTELAHDRWQLSPALTGQATWRCGDVTASLEPGPWDLVFWRNVSIYLHSDLSDRITAGITDRLRPGGYLVVGRAERPPAGLPLTRISRCIYRKDVHDA